MSTLKKKKEIEIKIKNTEIIDQIYRVIIINSSNCKKKRKENQY